MITVSGLLAGDCGLPVDDPMVQEQTMLVCQNAGIEVQADLREISIEKLEVVAGKLEIARHAVVSSKNRR